jgi:integrase/recombinase XerC
VAGVAACPNLASTIGTHPVQVVHEWNTAVHASENEADPRKRAFTVEELFEYADGLVARVRGQGRKGWLPGLSVCTRR